MVAWVLVFLFGLSAANLAAQAIKGDNTPLRTGCSDGAAEVARLSKGDPVKIRFALAGSRQPCYSVTVESGGNKLQGYLLAEDLSGLESFDQSRRQAPSVGVPARSASYGGASRASAAPRSEKPRSAVAVAERNLAMAKASELMQRNRFGEAQQVLEAAMRHAPNDPQLLAMAGTAAHQNDDARNALAYWRESLDLRPDPAIERLYRSLQKETAADKSSEKNYGMRFLLRYDGEVASPELARSMVEVLEQEFSRISFQLGCPAEERIVTIVQSRQSYGAAGGIEWSGGQYDGKIRIPLARGSKIDAQTRRVFAHEIVHACMSNIGQWPAWLHEGLAQKLSGDRLEPARRQVLQELAKAGKLPKLDRLGGNWSGASGVQAAVLYAQALAAAEMFFQNHSHYGVRNLMQNPDRLPQIAAELDRDLLQSLGGR